MTALIELGKQYKNSPELAGTLIENKKTGNIEERIVPYPLKFDKNGEPEFKYEKETELGKAEYTGLKSVLNLAKLDYKYVFWLSPEGGKSNYDQGRICVGIVKGEGELYCRGVPILVTASEMLGMGKEIVAHGGKSIEKIEKAEDLRGQAIGINLQSDEDLWRLCESVFGMKKVWETIIRGEDVIAKSKVEMVVNTVLIQIRSRYGEFTSKNSIKLGAIFEKEMKIRGHEMVGGNHGDLNSSLLDTSFNNLYSNSEISVKPEVRDGKKYCPCGKEIKEGVSVCPDCGLKISSGN